MAPLATIPDLEARIGPLNATQAARATALLEDASALVRDDTLQAFEVSAADDVVLRPIGVELILPSRPVTAVNSVTAIDCPPGSDLLLDAGLWCFDAIDTIRLDYLNGFDIEAFFLAHHNGAGTFRVNYDHGPTEIPPLIKAVVCGMVNRVLTSPSLASGLTQETIGQYGYQVQQSIGTQGTEVRYTKTDQAKLKRYRRTTHTIITKSG